MSDYEEYRAAVRSTLVSVLDELGQDASRTPEAAFEVLRAQVRTGSVMQMMAGTNAAAVVEALSDQLAALMVMVADAKRISGGTRWVL